jgi:hypothetical protein
MSDEYDEYEFNHKIEEYTDTFQAKYKFYIMNNKSYSQELFDKKHLVQFHEHQDAYQFAKSNKYRILACDIGGASFPVKQKIGFANRGNYEYFLSLFTEFDRPLIWFLTGGFHRVPPEFEFDI